MRAGFSVFAVLLVLTALLTACSNKSDTSGSTGSTGTTTGATGSTATGSTGVVDEAARALLPEAIQSKGSISAGTNAEYPPWQYLAQDNETPTGIEVDLVNAIAAKLGIGVDYSNVSFDAIVPGVQSGRFDLGTSTVTDTREREQVVDFVDFYGKVNVLIVQGGNPEGIQTLDDMCGKVASAQSGTDWAQLFEDQNTKCKAEGKPGIELKLFPLNTDTTLAVESGRTVATIEDYVSAAYVADKSGGKLEVLLNETYAPSVYGFAFAKGSDLLPAWQAGLKAIIADGTYDQIFQKYKVSEGLLKTAEINGAIT